ncbi:MAG: hypothetical protein U5K74_14635 [Gemmatimonadaceae bacterium]|nr:hypothetical protein [Gemmatimonadaceae bacterium]
MTVRVRPVRVLGSFSFAGAVFAMGALSGCGRSGPLPDGGLRPRILSNSAVTLLGRGPQNELEAALELAHDYRAHLLRASDFTDIGQDRCNDGWLRGFPRDSTDAMRESTADLVDKFEKLIQAYAVDAPLDTPEGHELLRTVVRWETGVERPRWDVWSGKAGREAIAAGLTEQVSDAATGRCRVNARGDTAAYVLPVVTGLGLPAVRGTKTQLVFGERGLSALRTRYWAAAAARDSSALLAYTRVSAAMLWKEYAVVTVHRPMERRDGAALSTSNGGGTYIFHRVGNTWLLLVIARSWG